MRVQIAMIGVLAILIAGTCLAQDQPTRSEPSKATEEKATQGAAKAPAMSAGARLAGAKTVFLKQGKGSEIPYNVISEGIEGWGRYALANSREKADLVIEISAPEDSGGISVSSTTGRDAYGKEQAASKTTRELSSSAMITMTVYDAKNNVPLWRGSEQSKSAMKQRARQDNMVESAQKLLARFRDRIEPIK